MKRFFDIFFSSLILISVSPLILIIAIIIKINSGGRVFFIQERVGQHNKNFKMFKFRTMHAGSDKKGLLTVGDTDKRITKEGYYLRKYKLDELPQFFNVLIGNMSIVGPRPEMRKYVDLYNEEQIKVLNVKPGITDIASLTYYNESNILAISEDAEKDYVEKIMPHKIRLNLEYIKKRSLFTDLKIVLKTTFKFFI